MGQLVRDGPVGGEFCCGRVFANAEAGKTRPAVHVSPGCALNDSVAAGDGNHEHARARDGKAPEVGGDRGGCRGDAGKNRLPGQIERAVSEVDLNSGCAGLDAIGFDDGELGAGLRVKRWDTPPRQSLDGAPQKEKGQQCRMELRSHY